MIRLRPCLSALLLALVTVLSGREAAAEPDERPVLAIDMETAVRLATERSPLLQRRAAAADAAAARRTAARGRLLPRVGFQASYTRLSHVEPGTVSVPVETPEGGASPGVTLGEAIDDRSAITIGPSVLLFDTLIDEQGEVGLFVNVRPIGLRWRLAKDVTLGLDPIGFTIVAPVIGGIPLILTQYRTSLYLEIAP